MYKPCVSLVYTSILCSRPRRAGFGESAHEPQPATDDVELSKKKKQKTNGNKYYIRANAPACACSGNNNK